jgi:hypothetical protein
MYKFPYFCHYLAFNFLISIYLASLCESKRTFTSTFSTNTNTYNRCFAESQIKNSRQRKNSQQRGLFAESQQKNSRQRIKHSAHISLPRAKWLALGKDILKIYF